MKEEKEISLPATTKRVYSHTNIGGKKHLKSLLEMHDDINFKKLKNVIDNNEHVKFKYFEKKNVLNEITKDKYKNLSDADKNHYREVLSLGKPYKNANKIMNKLILVNQIKNIKEELNLYGSVKGRSYIDNINQSSNHLYRATVDIKNFFPNTTFKKILAYFTEIYPKDIAVVLTLLCCYKNNDGELRLAQGFSTSSNIAYLVNIQMIREIKEVAYRSGCHFTMYVDDIVISSKTPIPQSLLCDIKSIIRSHGYDVNKKFKSGIKRPVHNIVKYKGTTILNKENTPLKTIYDQVIILCRNKCTPEKFLYVFIPLIAKYNGILNNIRQLDNKLVTNYQMKLYNNITTKINLQYRKYRENEGIKICYISKKSKQYSEYQKYLDIISRM